MPEKILLINAHPRDGSFSDAIAESYEHGIHKANRDVSLERVDLRDLAFDTTFEGYKELPPLEDDLKALQGKILDADHLVFVYPIWWGNVPGLLKSAIERVFLPGFGFKFESGSLLQKKLLKGKTARLIATMDAPAPIYKWIYGSPAEKQLKGLVLDFCGIRTVGIHRFGFVSRGPNLYRETLLGAVQLFARYDARPSLVRTLRTQASKRLDRYQTRQH